MSSALVDVSQLVGLKAAAEQLGVHRATVNEMVHDGRLRGIRVGPHWYIRQSDLDRFAKTYERPKNAPRRRDSGEAQRWLSIILSWLDDWHSASAAELDRVVDLHIGNIRKYLCLAERDGLVRRDDFGVWTLTVEGQRVAEASNEDLRAS
jgi:excisionase family DNA binding protein